MRIDPVVALTLMMLSLIVAATAVSMSWGYALGRSALKGVTQPDVRPPTSSLSSNQSQQADAADATEEVTEMVFWSESEILEEVKVQMNR